MQLSGGWINFQAELKEINACSRNILHIYHNILVLCCFIDGKYSKRNKKLFMNIDNKHTHQTLCTENWTRTAAWVWWMWEVGKIFIDWAGYIPLLLIWLHTAHCTLNTGHCILDTSHCTVTPYSLHTAHWTHFKPCARTASWNVHVFCGNSLPVLKPASHGAPWKVHMGKNSTKQSTAGGRYLN